MTSPNILIVGTGMYACGRGTDGYGTIMPAVCECKKKNRLGDVYVVGSTSKGLKAAKKKISAMLRDMNTNIPIRYFPVGSRSDGRCYKEAIRRIPKPAICIVAVPDDRHREIAGTAVENGLHTLVVKPLAPTLKEVCELIAIQDRKGVHCAVEYHKRLDKANMILKDVIANGDLGYISYIMVEYSQRKIVPEAHFKNWVKSTNVFQYLGIHYVDIIRYVTKSVPLRAMAIGQKSYLCSKGIDTYDSIQAIIEWKLPSGKKFSSCILTNWIDPGSTSAMSDQKIKVIGTKGRFESDQKNRGLVLVTDQKGIEEPNPYFCRPYGPAGDISYSGYGIESIHQFLNDVIALEDGAATIPDLEKIRPTFRNSMIPTAVLEAVNRSLRDKGMWVEIAKGF